MPDSERTPWVELQVLRAQADLTQKQLADMSGLSHTYLSDLEIGRRRPAPRIIAKLAAALKCPEWTLQPGRPKTTAEAAVILGVSSEWLQRNASSLPHHKYGRQNVFTEDDLEAIRSAHEHRPEPAATDGAAA